MSISFNTGATASADTAVAVSITIPAGVLVSDVMLMSLQVFTEDASTPTIAFTGAGGSWTLITVTTGTNPEIASGGGIFSYGFIYYRVATSGDPGQSLTITETGSPSGTTWLDVAIASYTGASTTAPVDVAGGTNIGNAAAATTLATPVKTTGVAGDWAVFLAAGGPGVGTTWVGPAGTTKREAIVDGAGIGAAIYDSNGPVGAAGTSIGGGTFSQSGGVGNVWYEVFTVGLAPAPVSTAAAPVLGGGMSQIKSRLLWEDL